MMNQDSKIWERNHLEHSFIDVRCWIFRQFMIELCYMHKLRKKMVVVMPTLVVTVKRGFPSQDAFLPGSSFSTMATTLSPLPYNR